MAIDWNSVFAKTKAMEKTIRKTKGTAHVEPSPVSDSPLLAPVKRAQASAYLTGDVSTPATPYAAGQQAGIVKTPERTTKPKTEKPTKEAAAPAWMGLLGKSAAELEQRHKTAMAERDALSKQVEQEETPTPNSTYAASAGRYKPKEANPISGSAAASGGWVSQEDKLLAPLRMAVSRKQDEVNDLAAAHYHRKNQEQFAKLEGDTAAKISYTSAKELTADLDALSKALSAPSSYNGHDTRFNAAGEALSKKYGTYDLQTLQRTLTAQKAKLVEDLAAKGYDFETMAGYDRMLAQQETYAKTQEKWQKDAEEHPVAASALSVFLSPLQGFDAVRTWGNGVGHSNADDLGSYVPANVYDMYATNAVQAIRGTVSKQIEENTDWELFGQNVASFLYNTGMSMADSALQVSTLGSGATFVMGLSSAANTTKEIIERGGSNEQAFWGGLAAGTAECVFEKFSVESLLKIKDVKGWKNVLKAALQQGGVEASEEMLTEVANILSDAMVMGDRSGLAASIRAYEEQGLTEQEAGLRATLDSIGQVSLAGAGGFLSGIGMAGGKLALQKGGNAVYDHFTRRQQRQTAENVTGSGVDSRLGSDVTVDTPTAQNPVEGVKNAPVEGAERVYHGQVLDTVRGHLNEVQNMAAVARLTGSEFQKQAGDTRPLRTKVMEFFNSLGNKVTRPDIGDIALTGAGARDSTAHGYGKLKAATFAALPSVLKDGKIIEVRGPYGGHSYDSIFISAPVEVDGATHYVGALVIKDANTQRYKLHEVLTTNESGTPLFKSETTGNADGPLRSDAPLGTSGDVPTMDSIPQTAQDVNPETGDGMPNSVGAAARGFTTPDAPNETRVSRQADTTLSYNDQRGAAASMTRGEWNESFRYEVQSREQWEQWAGERLFVERGGERLFIRDFDPAGYQALVEELETAPAWNATMRKTAEMVEQELRRRAAEPDMSDTNAVNEMEYRAFVDLVADKTRETARGLAAANLWEDGANDRGAATERMAWDTLEKSGLTPEERMERFRAVVKFDQDIERAGTDAEALRGVILDIGRARGVLNNSLTQKESALLNKLTESALEALDATELKQFAYASSAAMVGDAQGSDLGAKLKTVQVLNMLSNPKTAMRNLVGNTSFTALDAMTMRGGALLDMALSNLTGTRSIAMESSAFSKESRAAITKAIKRSIAEITLDVDMGAGNRYTGSGRRTFQANGNMVERVLSVMERNMGYLLTTTDEAYKGAARATKGATQKLIDEGKIKTNDPQYAQKRAEELEKYRTFQNDTVVSAALQSVHDFLNMFGVGDSGKRMFAGKLGDGKKGKVVHAFGAGDLVSPFTRVAANLWTVGVDYSPVNAVKGAAEIVSTIVDRVRTGSVDPAKQAKGVSNLTRGLTGTALAYGFMMLASAGFVRRADDEGDEDVAAMNRSEGMTGTQINVSAMQRAMSGGNAQWQEGDTLVDLSSVEPINLVIDMGLEMSKIQESCGGILSTYGGATMNSALHSAQDLPVLQGVSDMGRDVFEYHKNPFIAALEQVGNTAISSVTPNVLAAAAKGLDGKQRSTRSSEKEGLKKVGDVLLDTLKSRVPGLRQTLPTTTGPDGKEKENPGGAAQRLINAMLNPVGVNKYTQSDVSREMERVRGETGKTDFYPASKIPYSLSITKDGKTREVKLDYKQRQAFQASRSSTQMTTLAGVMGSRRYKAADAQLQADLLKRCYDYSYNRAKMEVLGKDAAPAWVDHAQHSKQELGISTADYFYYYETLGSEIMSGSGYEKTKRMVKAGVSLDAWGKMKPSLDADDSGSVNKAELTAYIEAHFPKGKWRQIFDAYNGNGNWKNPY